MSVIDLKKTGESLNILKLDVGGKVICCSLSHFKVCGAHCVASQCTSGLLAGL